MIQITVYKTWAVLVSEITNCHSSNGKWFFSFIDMTDEKKQREEVPGLLSLSQRSGLLVVDSPETRNKLDNKLNVLYQWVISIVNWRKRNQLACYIFNTTDLKEDNCFEYPTSYMYRWTHFIISSDTFRLIKFRKSERNCKSRKEFNFTHLMLRSLDGTMCVRLCQLFGCCGYRIPSKGYTFYYASWLIFFYSSAVYFALTVWDLLVPWQLILQIFPIF